MTSLSVESSPTTYPPPLTPRLGFISGYKMPCQSNTIHTIESPEDSNKIRPPREAQKKRFKEIIILQSTNKNVDLHTFRQIGNRHIAITIS